MLTGSNKKRSFRGPRFFVLVVLKLCNSRSMQRKGGALMTWENYRTECSNFVLCISFMLGETMTAMEGSFFTDHKSAWGLWPFWLEKDEK